LSTVLEYATLKIVNRVARLGLNLKTIFNMWDVDQNKLLDSSEIIKGVQNTLGIYLGKEEVF